MLTVFLGGGSHDNPANPVLPLFLFHHHPLSVPWHTLLERMPTETPQLSCGQTHKSAIQLPRKTLTRHVRPLLLQIHKTRQPRNGAKISAIAAMGDKLRREDDTYRTLAMLMKKVVNPPIHDPEAGKDQPKTFDNTSQLMPICQECPRGTRWIIPLLLKGKKAWARTC